MIDLKGIHKTYPGEQPLHVLKGVDLHVSEGEFVSVMGPSGCGKSTLLNVLGILDSFDAGEYRLDGQLINGLNRKEEAAMRNQNIGFVFQRYNLISFKNALENVELPLMYRGLPKEERRERAMKMIESVGLADRWDHLPSQMSGGQQQRVAIARALAAYPKIILADEPTGALDSKMSQEIMDLFLKLNEKYHLTMVLITHEPSLGEQTPRRIRMRDGLIESDESR